MNQSEQSPQLPNIPAPALYLVPTTLSDAPAETQFPPANAAIVAGIRHFIVENLRSARRFLRNIIPDFDIDGSLFYELNRHTDARQISSFLEPLRAGMPMAVMSEAGCPAVADPGAAVVEIAQREALRVVPMVGPSSILMSLMGSGFNGQGFAFHGYLPVDQAEKTRALRSLEAESERRDMTQIFIETPYRNNKMVEQLASVLRPDTMVCVACDITAPSESILSLPAAEWRRRKYDYAKKPAIFLIYRHSAKEIRR